jgi:hypothetical protein
LTPYSREGFLEPIYELIESVHGPFEMTYKCYNQLKARDKTSLDVFWLRDKSLTDLDNLPEPDELAEEIIENLEAGLDSFRFGSVIREKARNKPHTASSKFHR